MPLELVYVWECFQKYIKYDTLPFGVSFCPVFKLAPSNKNCHYVMVNDTAIKPD